MDGTSDTRELNVGGRSTMVANVTDMVRFPGYFRTMMTCGVEPPRDRWGFIPVPRSPKHIRSVFRYMYYGTTDLPSSEEEIRELLEEATFYQLDGLIELCGGVPSEDWQRRKKMNLTVLGMDSDDDFLTQFREEHKDECMLVIFYNHRHNIHDCPLVNEFVERFQTSFCIVFINHMLRAFCSHLVRPMHFNSTDQLVKDDDRTKFFKKLTSAVAAYEDWKENVDPTRRLS